MRRYKCIFFDLDHTLWDYETNSCDTLRELYHAYNLFERGVHTVESFQQQFRIVNSSLWELYDRGMINSETIRRDRFRRILGHFMACDDKLCEELSIEYLHACPKKANLLPHALETLDYLSDHYIMTVVTNGFDEIQKVKLASGNLNGYFDHVVTSQKAGHKKPAREIFEYAMKANDVTAGETVMIGDNLLTDIAGAQNASIDPVFFNPEEISHNVEVRHEIKCLSELRNIL